MAGRIESEAKKAAFLEACENLNTLKVVPEKLLQANLLSETLKMEEIDMTMLYKCGCPCDWIDNATSQCKKKRRKPEYSNQCTTCWLYNLTEEVNVDKTEKYDFKEVIAEYKEYKKFELTPSQLDEVLTYLGWKEIYDYGLFIDTVKDMKRVYDESGKDS